MPTYIVSIAIYEDEQLHPMEEFANHQE